MCSVSEDLMGNLENMKLQDYEYYQDEALPLDMSTTSASTAAPNQYCLRWNNHRANLLSAFEALLRQQAFTDVTLACEDGVTMHAHRLVLAACSSYFAALFDHQPAHHHPIVVLRDVKSSEMSTLLLYMYRGEVNVETGDLNGLLRAAEGLRVKGLVEDIASESQYQIQPIPLVTSSQQHRRDRSATPLSTPNLSRASTPMKGSYKDPYLSHNPMMPDMDHFYHGPHHPFSSPPPSAKRSHHGSPPLHRRRSISPSQRHPMHYPFIHSPRLFPPSHHPFLPVSAHEDPKDLRTSKDTNKFSRPTSPAHHKTPPDSNPSNHTNILQELTPSPSIPDSPPSNKRSRNHDSQLMSPPPLLRHPLGHPHPLSHDVSSLVSLANSMMPLPPSISSQFLSPVPAQLPPASEMNPLSRSWENSKDTSVTTKNEAVSEWMERGMGLIKKDSSPLLPSFGLSLPSHPSHQPHNLMDQQKEEPLSEDEDQGSREDFTDLSREEEKFQVGSLMPEFSNNYTSVDTSNAQLHGSFGGGLVSCHQNGSNGPLRPEWKRYKQYSKADLMEAIEAVKSGMTALMASRKFKVPSRTLYDKIKKMGINTIPRRITHKKSPTLTDLERDQCFRDALADNQLVMNDYRQSLKVRRNNLGPMGPLGPYKHSLFPTKDLSFKSNMDNSDILSQHSDQEGMVNLPHQGSDQKRPHSHDGTLDSSTFNTKSNSEINKRPPSVGPLMLSPSKIPQIPLTILDPPRINSNSIRDEKYQNLKMSHDVAMHSSSSPPNETPEVKNSGRGSFIVESTVLRLESLQQNKSPLRSSNPQIEEKV